MPEIVVIGRLFRGYLPYIGMGLLPDRRVCSVRLQPTGTASKLNLSKPFTPRIEGDCGDSLIYDVIKIENIAIIIMIN